MTRTNTMYSLGRWCLLFATMMTAAFAAPSFAKTYKAELLDAQGQPTQVLPSGTTTITLKVYNTSTEPATINSLVICKLPNVTLTSVAGGTLLPYVPSGGDANVCVSPANPTGAGYSVTNFTGFKRQTFKIFNFVGSVSGACADPAEWPIFVSTGNTFTSTDKFTQDAKTFVAVGCDVVLSSCTPPSSYTETSGGNTTKITRLEKPGFTCNPKSFNVLFSNGDNQIDIKWVGLGVVLKTETDWPPSLVNAQTTQAKTTWVSWALDGNNAPILIPVPTCTSDQPPTTNPVTDPFPLINSDVKMPNPDGSYTFVDNPYKGQRAKICAIEETYSVFSPLNGPNPPDPPCPAPPSGLDPGLVLGCVARHTILYISDDISIINR